MTMFRLMRFILNVGASFFLLLCILRVLRGLDDPHWAVRKQYFPLKTRDRTEDRSIPQKPLLPARQTILATTTTEVSTTVTVSVTANRPTPTSPGHYRDLDVDEEECEALYGESYLTYPSAHQTPYCESDSLSALQCFNVRRHPNPHPWNLDTFCVAHGANLEQGLSTQPETEEIMVRTYIDLKCQLRNFTAEKLDSEQAAEELRDVEDILKLPEYFYWTGVRDQLYDWKITPSAGGDTSCFRDSPQDNGKWILLVRREDNRNIFHKLMEVWQAMVTFDMVRMAINPSTGKPYMSAEDVMDARVVFEDNRTEGFEDWWDIVIDNGQKPLRKSKLADDCYGNVILPLPGSSSPFWTLITEGPWIPSCRNEFLTRAMRKRFFKLLDVKTRPRNDIHVFPNITVIDRKETRNIHGIDHLMRMVKRRYPEAIINVVDFAQIPIKQQVQLVIDTDILIGVHGAALLHLLWLQPEAAFVEIRPPGFNIQGFRRYATILGTNYFTVNAIWPEIWNFTMNGIEPPDDWEEPVTDPSWQTQPFSYVVPDEFLSAVDAALRSQDHRLTPNRENEKYDIP